MSTVSVSKSDGVAIVTIERPECRNAVDGPTADLLYEAFLEADEDDGVSIMVLQGRGGNFCAGADLKAIAGEGAASTRIEKKGHKGPMGPTRLTTKKPVIAAIEGYAVAGGLELALWADLRVAAESATFGVFCRRFGVPLVDLGAVRLPRLIGHGRAMDLILTGRPVSASEGLAIGLVTQVVPDGKALDAALALARSILVFPQACLRGDRALALEQWSLSWDEALDREVDIGLKTLASGETRNGAGRFAGGQGRHGVYQTLESENG